MSGDSAPFAEQIRGWPRRNLVEALGAYRGDYAPDQLAALEQELARRPEQEAANDGTRMLHCLGPALAVLSVALAIALCPDVVPLPWPIAAFLLYVGLRQLARWAGKPDLGDDG